jgi:UDP-glucose 4-epimerase
MKRILVTGGAGFIGSHLVERLVKLNHEVIVIDDFSNGSLRNLKNVENDISIIKHDVSRPLPPTLSASTLDVIYHLACFPRSRSFSNPQRDVEVNVIGMVNVLEAAKKSKAKVIFSSNSGIYDTSRIPIGEDAPDDPKTPYDLDKLQAEQYLKLYHATYGVGYTIFRFATVYGPRQKVSPEWKPVVIEFIMKLKAGEEPVIYWDGEQTRDLIYVDDVVNALVLALDNDECNGETMILGSGKETSINELYGIISDVLDVHIEPKRGPKQLGDIRRMLYNCEKAERILNWRARIPLKEGIKRVVEWIDEENLSTSLELSSRNLNSTAQGSETRSPP